MEFIMFERVKIIIDITAEFWDQPPMIDLVINDTLIGKHVIDKKHYVIDHSVDLEISRSHKLKLKRYNKSDDQCTIVDGNKKDQYVILDRVSIDGIDIQNLIWSRSWYEPQYPEVWKQQQEQAGTMLEEKVIGETWLSHNGVWSFEFTSPFYLYVIKQFK